MDYEKEYKDALERARGFHSVDENNTLKLYAKGTMEYLFPVLKKSEDEKIRKYLLKLADRCPEDNIDFMGEVKKEDVVAWLEKQGKNNMGISETTKKELEDNLNKALGKETPESWNKFLDEKGEQNPYTGTSFEYNGHTWGMCARDNGVEILFDGELKAFLSSEKSFIYPIHPQPVLAPKNAMEAIKEERIDNQNCVKPTDMVEPKFKIEKDKWYVCIKDLLDNYANTAFHKGDTYLSTQDGSLMPSNSNVPFEVACPDTYFRDWTIQDAKDGDVLFGSEWGVILMFRGIGNTEWDNVIDYHCYYDNRRKEFIVQKELEYWGNTENHQLKPATKEQRDLLFQKMKEAGYEWDVDKKELNVETKFKVGDRIYEWDDEKKELKKIHNALEECEIENIEHGKYYYCIKDYFCGGRKQASKGDVVQALRGMSMMALGVKANEYFLPVNSIKQKTDWSKEDDSKIESICRLLKTRFDKDTCDEVGFTRDKMCDYLSSLKNKIQPQWKPSDEQMHYLSWIANIKLGESVVEQEVSKRLNELYEDLKKLKG